MDKQDQQPKKHNEKPLSLHPMTMDEALAEVLQVKPPAKDDKKRPAKKM